MKATDTAILGHLGTNDTLYLSAVASADLWTSSTGVFIQGRVLGTFVGQAIGAGHRDMAGVWLQVRDCNGISKLTLIQLNLYGYKGSLDIPLLSLAPGVTGVSAAPGPGPPGVVVSPHLPRAHSDLL